MTDSFLIILRVEEGGEIELNERFSDFGFRVGCLIQLNPQKRGNLLCFPNSFTPFQNHIKSALIVLAEERRSVGSRLYGSFKTITLNSIQRSRAPRVQPNFHTHTLHSLMISDYDHALHLAYTYYIIS